MFGVNRSRRSEMLRSRMGRLTFLISLLSSCPFLPLSSQSAVELRGVWFTPRVGTGFMSKAEIGRGMDSIAAANFNVVYFNAWSRGFPLFRSEVFHAETGYYTDPSAGDRDILQEAIGEAHRAGLEIEAWMEYGFAGWWSGYNLPGMPKGPLFEVHPDWTARDRNGNDLIGNPEGTQFYWLGHNNREARDFLRDLHVEIAQRYDVDGIELDRVRYPGHDLGYDSASVTWYRAEHSDSLPPSNVSDPSWMRWRADKLNAWHKEVYDSIKAINPELIVSNAPSHYASGAGTYPAYSNYLQDWKAWLEGGYLDGAQVQMYVSSSILAGYIPSALYGLSSASADLVYAGMAAVANTNIFAPDEIIRLVTTARNGGLSGQSWWYHTDLQNLGYYTVLRNAAYQERADVPHRPELWRPEPIQLSDGLAVRSSGFQQVSFVNAAGGSVSYAPATGVDSMSFMATVPYEGSYELYAYVPDGLNNLTSTAPYRVRLSMDMDTTVILDQAASAVKGWTKLADVFLHSGTAEHILTVSNNGIGTGKNVVADDIMLILNRRLTPSLVTSAPRDPVPVPAAHRISRAFPNPFNPSTTFSVELSVPAHIGVSVFDLLGRKVAMVHDARYSPGTHMIPVSIGNFASGTYVAVFSIKDDDGSVTLFPRRMILMR